MTKWLAVRWLLAGVPLLLLGCRVEPAPSLTPVGVSTALSVPFIQAANTTAARLDGDVESSSAPAVTHSPAAAPAQVAAEDEGSEVDERVYAWEDADGSVRYGRLGDAPPGLGKRARLVTAEIGSVSAGDWPAERPASTSTPTDAGEPTAEERPPPSAEPLPPAEVGPGGERWSVGGVLLLAAPKRAHHPHFARTSTPGVLARGQRIHVGPIMHGGRRH